MSAKPELLSRLERLAAERNTDPGILLSEAITAYLECEEATLDLTAKNSPDEPDEPKDVVYLPPLPPVVHLRSPRLANPQDAARLRKVMAEVIIEK